MSKIFLLGLIGLLSVACVGAQEYRYTIVLKPGASAYTEVNCEKGDLIEINAKSTDGNYFEIRILNETSSKPVFSRMSNNTLEDTYEVPSSGRYTVVILDRTDSKDVVVEYTIYRVNMKKIIEAIEAVEDLKLKNS